MKYKITLLLLFILSAFKFIAQTVSSTTYVQTCYNKTQCSSINNSSFLFFDEARNELYLKVDFNNFKSGEDSIDDWLNDLTETALYFKAPFQADNFSGLSNHNHKNYTLHGQVFFNGIWHNQTIELSVFAAESNTLGPNNNGNKYDNYKVNFSLSIAPKDFKIHKKPHHLTKTIYIGLALGRINLLLPGKETILGEAYKKH